LKTNYILVNTIHVAENNLLGELKIRNFIFFFLFSMHCGRVEMSCTRQCGLN